MAQTLGSVAVGTLVKLNENGSPVDFYVAEHDYESGLNGTGRVLVVRKDCYDLRAWDADNVNAYATSDIDTWMNGDYKGLFPEEIQTAMGTTEFYYTPGNGNNTVTTLERPVFALSLTELGQTSSYANTEGSELPIASTLLIAYRNGRATTQWTRSPYTDGTSSAWRLSSSGSIDGNRCSYSRGARPAFTLPSDLFVLDDGTILVPIPAPSTLTVPQLAMQGNQITVSWSAVDGADGYIMERKANTDADWTQVYSGANTSFEETVGTWTSVQYRVKAGVSGTYGDYTTSASVPVVSASAVVISGTDGDLGTLVNDVSYTVSSDGSTELTVVETINGTETRTYTATNGATNKIPVVDLPTGYGTIKITASTNPGSGVVTVTREWTYTKAAITFPDAGGVADLTQQGKTIWAKTIAEAVRTPGIWGGNLGLALQKLANAVLYDPETGGFNGIGGADATIPMVSIETGSYVGTGTFGQDNPNTLTLPFKPDILIIQKRYQEPSANTNWSFAIISAESGFATNQFLNGHNPSGFLTLWVTSTENSISWYAGPSAGAQQNAQNIPYYYTAIGKAGGAT